MELVDDDQNDGFSFIWTINNFSYCVQNAYGEPSLQSPHFMLYGNSEHGKVQIKELQVAYVLSIRTVRGIYKKVRDSTAEFPRRVTGHVILVKQDELHKKGDNAYLDNDSLTIRCRVIKVNDTILETEQCYARTVISVQRAFYTWNLNTLSKLRVKELDTKQQINLKEITSFKVKVSMTEHKFEIAMKRSDANKLYFSICIISLLNAGKVIDSVRNEHWFEEGDGEQIWISSFIPKPSFLTILKQNSAIYLQCEIGVSFGIESSIIEKNMNGSTVYRPLVISNPTMDSDILGPWKENLHRFYSEGGNRDLTIRTPSKEFPVHKAMLSSQSPVFCAMIERDMKENRTGIVEIEDLEDETISMMLLFVYTCSIADLDWEKAFNLYFAADKYEMPALKERCSIYLKENLTTSNICKCLILADMHQDKDLKSGAQDFFTENSYNIIISDEWKELVKEQRHLADETMQLILMRNLKV